MEDRKFRFHLIELFSRLSGTRQYVIIEKSLFIALRDSILPGFRLSGSGE
jgi:hypothetical protein